MSRLTPLRVARWVRGRSGVVDHPNLEALIEAEADKPADAYHLARWIAPASAAFLALAVFLPLALTVHPGFWFGFGGSVLVGGILGAVFHRFAGRISGSQRELRKRCAAVGQRMVGLGNLIGATPTLSPLVADVLEDAARIYLSVPEAPARPGAGMWDEAAHRTREAMDAAMAQMMRLAEPATPEAQEVELGRGWAWPLLDEMRAAAELLSRPSPTSRLQELGSAAAPLAHLADARAQLERLQTAAAELDQAPEATVRLDGRG